MELPALLPNDNSVYFSAAMMDRRQRILNAAVELISRNGYDGFRMRDLCEKADVAPQTVYKAFDSKERLVSLAIRQHFISFIGSWPFEYPRASIQGIIERVIVSDDHMHDSREFVTALVALYFSHRADPELHFAVKMNIEVTLQPWALSLRDQRGLRRGIAVEQFINNIVSLLFNVSLEWCRGKISNQDFVLEKLQALLTYASGATRGPAQKEIELYLNDLLGKRILFAAIRSKVDDVEERVEGRKAKDAPST